MPIKLFTQGKSAKEDRELFGLVGGWLVDVNLQNKLGASITAKAGDIWLVSQTEKGAARGFSTARMMSNGGLHVRFVHCPDDAPLMCRAMIMSLISHAKESNCSSVWTNDKPDNPHWLELGFKFTKRARGTYGRWDKLLELKS